MKQQRMAPTKLRTYGRSNKSIVTNSVDAVNVLFAKNKAKVQQNRKRKLLIKELPLRPRGQTLLADDSFHVSLEDTFDKIVKGKVYNKIKVQPQINISNANASKSIKQVNTYYSPIMTRRKKRIALLNETSSDISKSNDTNKSSSIIPHFLNPTVDKIDFSLEIEKMPKPSTSLSYIKLPEHREVSKLDANTSRKEISYDPIFTNTFREKQMIHSSTPLVPMKRKEKIINYTISPIKNLVVLEKSMNTIKRGSTDMPSSDIRSRRKSARKTVNTFVQSNSLPEEDWKLQTNPSVLLRQFPQLLVGCKGNASENSPKNFVTLRRVIRKNKSRNNNKKHQTKNLNINAKELIMEVSNVRNNTNLTRSLQDFNSFMEKASGSKNMTRSLEDFEAFVEKMQSDKQKSETNSSPRTHQLNEFESFVAENRHLFGSSEPVNKQKKTPSTETPIQFVTKRRRRLTDSCLVSAKKLNDSKGKSKTKRPNRRVSLQESTCLDYPNVSLKEMVVMLSEIDFTKEMTDLTEKNTDNEELSENTCPSASNKFIGNIFSEVTGDSDPHESSSLKELVVNLTRMQSDPRPHSVANQTNNDVYSLLEGSEPLFAHSENYTNNSEYTIESASIPAEQMLTKGTKNISTDTSCDLSIKKVGKNQPRISKRLVEGKRSRSVNALMSSVQEKTGDVILEDSCTYFGSLDGHHLSNESIVIEETETPEKSTRKTTNIQACDFENFFVNMTNKTKSPKRLYRKKSSANKEQLSEISDNCKEINYTAETVNQGDTETDGEPKIKSINSAGKNRTLGESSVVIAKNSCESENSFNITKRSRLKSESYESQSNVSERQSSKISDRVSDRKLAKRSQYQLPQDKETEKVVLFDGANLSNEIDINETHEVTKRNSSIKGVTISSVNEYEKFFGNMTNRTKSPKPRLYRRKSAANKEKPLEISDNKETAETVNQGDKETDGEPKTKGTNSAETNRTLEGDSSVVIAENVCKSENSSNNITKRSRLRSESFESKSTVSERHSKISDRKLAKKTLYQLPQDKETEKGAIFDGADLSNEIDIKETRIKGVTTSSANEYEKFFVNTIKRSGSSKGKLGDNKYMEIEEPQLQKIPNSPAINSSLIESLNVHVCDEKVEKTLCINLTKSPWRKKDGCPAKASLGSVVIDLTASISEGCSNKFSAEFAETPKSSLTQPALNSVQTTDSPDIIESSLVDSDIIDVDGFRVPSVSSSRRRQSKTLVLKAGKLWRRSFSVYKRSSVVLSVLNEGACITKDGRYCNCPKCKVSRESRCITSRRFSIKIVPATPLINSRETSILENYAHNTSYVSDQILEDNLENSIRSLSLSKRKTSIIPNSAPVTARELVLRRCGQTEPLPFGECYPGSVLLNCQKIGEGVYGEVFLFRNPNGGTSVMKVIPIEGHLIVNGERQKKFEEILSEIVIAMELSNLRNKNRNTTSGFSETQKIHCVQGCYPEKLLDLWDLYDETRGSENDSPEIFGEDQLYIVLQLANGGLDLEAFVFNNSLQAYTMFQQVACSLAVAEEELRFEHRDLHWGNILLSTVDKNKKLSFRLDGKIYEIMTKGVEVAIIDFTLSRIECDGVVIFNDLSLDPDIFTAEGDYQFEIYKLMQKKNGNNWERFEPYTNILWLHYTLDKAITALRYKNVQTKIHKEYISKLKQLKNDILNYNSVKEFVLNNF